MPGYAKPLRKAAEFWHQGLMVRRIDDGTGRAYLDVVLFVTERKAEEVAARAAEKGFSVVVVPHRGVDGDVLFAMMHDVAPTPWPRKAGQR